MSGPSLIEQFAALEDPRQSWKVLFALPEVLLLVLCGTLAGAEDFVEIRRWGGGAQRQHQLGAALLPVLDAARRQAVRLRRAVPTRHVENRLHWVLGVVFHEDLSWLRSGAGPQGLATVRHIAMNLLRAPKNKHSLKVRRKSAAWDTAYLQALLRQPA